MSIPCFSVHTTYISLTLTPTVTRTVSVSVTLTPSTSGVCITTTKRNWFMFKEVAKPGQLVSSVLCYMEKKAIFEKIIPTTLHVLPERTGVHLPGATSELSLLPLFRRFGTTTESSRAVSSNSRPEKIAAENGVKEQQWEAHFSEFGRGVSMFRTPRDRDLVLKGVPDSVNICTVSGFLSVS